MDPFLEETGKEMAAARMWIPEINREKFDIETRSFFAAMAEAGPERRRELLEVWRGRAELLKRSRTVSHAPPMLCRIPGEPISDYVNRCYDAGGFR